MEENKEVIEEINEVEEIGETDVSEPSSNAEVDATMLLVAAGVGVALYEGTKFVVKRAIVPGVKKLGTLIKDKMAGKGTAKNPIDTASKEVQDDKKEEEDFDDIINQGLKEETVKE